MVSDIPLGGIGIHTDLAFGKTLTREEVSPWMVGTGSGKAVPRERHL